MSGRQKIPLPGLYSVNHAGLDLLLAVAQARRHCPPAAVSVPETVAERTTRQNRDTAELARLVAKYSAVAAPRGWRKVWARRSVRGGNP